jgi:hypothetical protein
MGNPRPCCTAIQAGKRPSSHADRRIPDMNERDAPGSMHTNRDQVDQDPMGQDPMVQDHWEIFAEAMDLTIEGHRLIAEEIIYEAKLAWTTAVSWLRGLAGMTASPPV